MDKYTISMMILFSYKEILLLIHKFSAPHKFKFYFAIFFIVLAHGIDLIFPIMIGRIVDILSKYSPGSDLTEFIWLCIGLGVLTALFANVRLKTRNALMRHGLFVSSRVQVAAFERMLLYPINWHQKEMSGNKAEKISGGCNSLKQFIRLMSGEAIPTLVTLVGVFIAFAFLHWIFAIFLVAYVLIFYGIIYFFNKRILALHREAQSMNEKTSGVIYEGINNIYGIKALGADRAILTRVENAAESARASSTKQINAGNVKWRTFQTFNAFVQTGYFLLLGYFVVNGMMSVGMIVTYFAYFRDLMRSMIDSTSLLDRLMEARNGISRLHPFFEHFEFRSGELNFPKQWKKISFENVSFNYGTNNVFNDFSLSINRNEIVGIKGESGKGKSTLVKILLGLYGVDGGVVKIGSHSVYDISAEELTKNISLVLQEPELFNLSLKENISLSEKIDNISLKKAFSYAQLDDLVSSLNDGMDSLIGEKGYSLSGGQRQRVGIARAIYKDAPILIMDEATSALDNETEEKVMRSIIADYKGKKTLIIIAHRDSTLMYSDRIISL